MISRPVRIFHILKLFSELVTANRPSGEKAFGKQSRKIRSIPPVSALFFYST